MKETVILRTEELAVAKQNRFFGKTQTLGWLRAIKNLRVKFTNLLWLQIKRFSSPAVGGQKKLRNRPSTKS